MAHTHKYETVERYPVSTEARELGIEDAERRKCSGCGHEDIFLHAHGKWVMLSEETTEDARDILLA